MNFREAIIQNNRRTKLVVASYVLIMFLVGLLADVVVSPVKGMGLMQNLMIYATFQKIPFVTLIVLACTIIGIAFIHFFGHKIMLSGSDYRELTRSGNNTANENQLINIVEEMAISANLGYTPKIFVMNTPEMNAFAAGWGKENSIVGITTGLMEGLSRNEIQAVMAHEIGHIIHGDSKLTMYVGILANVILTFTNIFAQISYVLSPRSNNDAANKARIALIVLNLVLPIITQVLYFYLSRKREYMADAAAVQLTGDNQAMISALQKISGNHGKHKSQENNNEDSKPMKTGEYYRNAAYIFEKGDSIFSTHPSIENRIKKLNGGQVD